MRKLISFSLWGNDPKYTIGAIKNAQLLESIYPGWVCRFYVGLSVPNEIVKTLKSINNVEVFLMDKNGDWSSMFWRFYGAGDENYDVIIFRDTDSRINTREKLAVDEWLSSNKSFHIMRDHPWHGARILGGMWGVKNNKLRNISKQIEGFNTDNHYQVDQEFLSNIIFPIIGDDVMVHDEFFSNNPFPTPRENHHFVGEVFNENDIRDPEHWKMIP